MDIDIPGANTAQPRASLEEELSAAFIALLADDRTAKDTVVEVYNVCQQRVEAHRSEASEQLHRPARHMALKALADEMEAHAATWQLLFCLHCDEAPPAGEGGPGLADAGQVALYRQRQADCVKADRDLARCARVVAWLESLAEESLRRQRGAAFAPGEGLWHETLTEMQGRAGSVVSELDPDAPGRTGRPLHPSNARSQERVLARVWQLLRGGQLPEALELCQHVGQPWRAAALGGGGSYGFLPVGAAAVQHDEEVRADLQVEELADEVAHGSGTLLALWRWAAQQAAAAPPGDKFERAVFGAVAGSPAAEAPACGTWEDFAWSYCRSWLESQVFKTVPPEPCAASDLVAGDVVTAALVRCGIAPAAAQRSMEGAMSVVLGTASNSGGGAAGAATADGGGDVMSSRGFGQLFAQHVMTHGSLVHSGSPAVQALRQVQGLLVQGDMHALAMHLYGLLVERRGAFDASAAGASGVTGDDVIGGGGGGANPDRRWRSCALLVHMLLALEGLGTMSGGGEEAMSDEPDPRVRVHSIEVQRTLDLSQRLLMFYVSSLLDRQLLPLVPPYLCGLRQALRSSLCGELLALHTRRLTGVDAVANNDTSNTGNNNNGTVSSDAAATAARLAAADSECFDAFVTLSEWFRRCVDRQQQPQEVLASRLITDVRPNELRIQLVTFALACRHNQAYGPHQRARVARWLVYPYVAAIQAAAAEATAAAAAEQQLDEEGVAAATEAAVAEAAARLDPVSHFDVLDYTNCLCCELALGDDVTAAAGHLLFEEILPEELDLAALSASKSLAEAAVAAGAAAAEAAAQAGPDAELEPLPFPLLNRNQPPTTTTAAAVAQEAEAAGRLAIQIRDQAAELAAWRLYFRLDAQLAQWTARHEAVTTAGSAGGGAGGAPEEEVEALVADGGALLQAYLSELLQVGWQRELSSEDRALEAAAASPDGLVRVALTVVSPPGSAAAVPSTGSAWGQPTASYPGMQAFPLLNLKLALQEGLQQAAAAVREEVGGLVEVAVAEGPGEPPGHVAVTLTAPAEPQSWRALVGLVCGAVRGGLEGVPPVLLVGMEADRTTSLAVCRRCCMGQAVLRCAALRLSLVALGADAHSPATGPQLLEMLAAPPEGPGATRGSAGLGLLDLLTPPQLQHVLAVEADTVVQHLRNQQQQRCC